GNHAGDGGDAGSAGYNIEACGTPGYGGSGGSGGAVFVTSGSSSMRNVTVARNYAGNGNGAFHTRGCFQPDLPKFTGGDGLAGGLFVQGPPAMSLQSTIVSESTTRNCSSTVDAPFVDRGHNISFPDTTCPGINGDPRLAALADNGGPTQTMALGNWSVAFDQVPT